MSANGVTQYMPQTGGRPDIGITTAPNAAWLMSGDLRAAEYAMGQAEAASAVPWNFWDAAHKAWLNIDNYKNVWTDYGTNSAAGDALAGSLTQQVAADRFRRTTHYPRVSCRRRRQIWAWEISSARAP